MVISRATIAAEFPSEVIVAVRLVFVSRGLTVYSRWFVLTAGTSVLFFKILRAPSLSSPSVMTRVGIQVFHREK